MSDLPPQEVDTTPREINIRHYAGDPLSIFISSTPAEWIELWEVSGQVRRRRSDPEPLAEFEIQIVPGGVMATLTSAACRELCTRELPDGTTQQRRFRGYWDIQCNMPALSESGPTIGTGTLELDLDVTRGAV